MRIPNHIGIIPDGNRRWAVDNGLSKDKGYTFAVSYTHLTLPTNREV